MAGDKLYRFAYVGIIGRANAGKSSLLNQILGQKIAIMSNKPQTTRNNILGIYTTEQEQLVFVDTPGIHKSATALDKYMMKNVRTTLESVDIILYLVDSSIKTDDDEKQYIQKLKNEGKEVIVVLTKCDKKQNSDLIADIKISINDKNTIDNLLNLILSKIEGTKDKNFMYDEDEITDKSVKFVVAEYIREAILKRFSQEIPHGIAVEILQFDEDGEVVNIMADIVCERNSHKGMIIGKGGQMLKEIGKQARLDSENLLQKKVYLKLFVKVEEDWRNKPNKLTGLGY